MHPISATTRNVCVRRGGKEREHQRDMCCVVKSKLCPLPPNSPIFYPPSSGPRTVKMINMLNSHKGERAIHLQTYSGVKLGPAPQHASLVHAPAAHWPALPRLRLK